LDTKSPFDNSRPPAIGRIRKIFGGLFDLTVLVSFIGFIIYSMLVSPTPKIITNSQTYHPIADYKKAAQQYLGSLTNRNKITLNEQAIVQKLQERFPEIAGAYIELPVLSQTPLIHLNIAQPSFTLINNNFSYIVDSQGVAVAKSNQENISPINNNIYVTDQSGFIAKAGLQVMSASAVQFIDSLTAQLKHANVPVKAIVLPPLAQELYLQTTDRPYLVKFFLGGDVLQQTGQFLASRHQFDTKGGQPSTYLDVRVPGKVYYK